MVDGNEDEMNRYMAMDTKGTEYGSYQHAQAQMMKKGKKSLRIKGWLVVVSQILLHLN